MSANITVLAMRRVNFEGIAFAALTHATTLVPRWLPHGKRMGWEWVATNPMRLDRNAGSFRINLKSGCWADFATSDRGTDLISLAGYLYCDGDQGKAARLLAEALSVNFRVN